MRRVRIDGEALVRLSVHPSFYVISVKSHADSRHRALLFDRYRLRCFCSLPLIYLLPLVLFCLVHWKEDSEEEAFNSELYRNVDTRLTLVPLHGTTKFFFLSESHFDSSKKTQNLKPTNQNTFHLLFC